MRVHRTGSRSTRALEERKKNAPAQGRRALLKKVKHKRQQRRPKLGIMDRPLITTAISRPSRRLLPIPVRVYPPPQIQRLGLQSCQSHMTEG